MLPLSGFSSIVRPTTADFCNPSLTYSLSYAPLERRKKVILPSIRPKQRTTNVFRGAVSYTIFPQPGFFCNLLFKHTV